MHRCAPTCYGTTHRWCVESCTDWCVIFTSEILDNTVDEIYWMAKHGGEKKDVKQKARTVKKLLDDLRFGKNDNRKRGRL